MEGQKEAPQQCCLSTCTGQPWDLSNSSAPSDPNLDAVAEGKSTLPLGMLSQCLMVAKAESDFPLG